MAVRCGWVCVIELNEGGFKAGQYALIREDMNGECMQVMGENGCR